ncbi:MAG: hypothetical protein A2087_04120 [Spirochaetes bacterium GWD1_61_31]|nr:MAG: hypothetical protein A2Y37_02320 [Spirochaetes bacterium GWB1_60_80]OHD33296.1 MAG: hypothetical protein A2004_07600 [Spirochaetes bacterium GWC1_61_12]OHD41583.1 MAG: hypothetical protein A2Y35_02460 [Spirochaetes bacterium GWE1_60_18]OHD44325.1 MAG: hypothetical protein A2087_04120 [Spirochaetes bacterium GWD1_61_31]OHD61488.1 MAG: hypothetical protein A2Y32_02730 [Spirochaetes bacterium GWF1_60_12]HAP43403.1 hypothetical protein [Spirochaetaceae bacterium]
MVNPLYLFAASLAAAFLLPLVDKLGRRASLALVYLVGLAWLAAAVSWLLALVQGGVAQDFGTAGFMAPLAIVLRVGLLEAAGVLAVAAVGLLSAAAMHASLRQAPAGGAMAFLMLLMGLCGVILTRDLFNLFVFLEISAIATYSLIGFDDRRPALRSAFKYMLAGGIASALYLIGVIYVYRFGDTLNLDLAIRAPGLAGAAGNAALFFLLAALLVELKPFPANGWALDVYQTAHPGLAAMLSGASATALLLALWKLLPLFGTAHLVIIAGSGLATFLAGNLAGARQRYTRRMLGYSSVAQIGLAMAVLALGTLFKLGSELFLLAVAGGFVLNHLLAKTGLFLLSAAFEQAGLTDAAGVDGVDVVDTVDDAAGASAAAQPARRLSPLALAVAGGLVLALVGLPPFPGFWAKWQLVQALADRSRWWLIGLILGGSLVEAFYMLRWLGRLVAARGAAPVPTLRLGAGLLGPAVAAVALAGLGVLSGVFGLTGALDPKAGSTLASLAGEPWLWAPWAVAAVLFLLDWLPGWLKGLLALGAVAAFAWLVQDRLDGLRQIFAIMLLGGGGLFIVAALRKPGSRGGLHPLLAMVTLSLGAVLLAETRLGFFFAWETMTLSSWLLVRRGQASRQPALSYIVFGLGGAFLLMVGLAAGGFDSAGAWPSGALASWPFLLALVGILVKAGALGLHVWLPGAYAEADDESSGLLSASLSKAAVFGLFALVLSRGIPGSLSISLGAIGGPWLWRALGWVGLATALAGALYAVWQEDIKKTLAWSSMGQIGYIILAFALMDQAGWTASLYLAFNHFLYKSMLFLAVAGVIQRVGTRNMYEMGGLIKKMPVSFLTVLMAIIALSGVPPLTGFGGKWLLYSSLIAKGWYLEAAVAFFASGVAFLYLYRLIHSIFLGQPKLNQSGVREAPLALIAPQLLLMGVLMALSVFPKLLLDPILEITSRVFPPTLGFSGDALVSPLGYWNGTLTMIVTGGVFALCLLWLVINLRNSQGVRQFNIVFAGERPLRPETTHYAWRFFEPYRQAVGGLVRSRAERFWVLVGGGVSAVGGALRRLYTGNGQTYALHVVMYVVVLYLVMGVVL